MSNSLKGLILAAGIIITLIVVGLGFYVAREAKSTANSGVSQISKMNSEFNESDKAMYDGLEVSGSEVINVINRFSNDAVAIVVTTKKSTSYYGYNITTDASSGASSLGSETSSSVKNAQDVKNSAYINPNSQFIGNVMRDENMAIIGITFTQQ